MSDDDSEKPYFNIERRGNVITVSDLELLAGSVTPKSEPFLCVKVGGRNRYLMGGPCGRRNVHALQWITNTYSERPEYDISEYDEETKRRFMEFGELSEVSPGIVRRQ